MTEPYLPHQPHALEKLNTTIEACSQTLLRQGAMTADEFLHSAIDHIDAQLGKGYAKAHPELIAAFMQTSAMDLGAAVIARAIESTNTSSIAAAIEGMADAISGLDESLRSDHRLQGQTLDGIETALNSIATAISEHKE